MGIGPASSNRWPNRVSAGSVLKGRLPSGSTTKIGMARCPASWRIRISSMGGAATPLSSRRRRGRRHRKPQQPPQQEDGGGLVQRVVQVAALGGLNAGGAPRLAGTGRDRIQRGGHQFIK